MAIPENNIRLELELLLISRGVALNDIAVQKDIDLTLFKIVRALKVHEVAMGLVVRDDLLTGNGSIGS